ncbi:DUF84 family protein [Bacillus timonensis]|uniref:Probable inosine/xanthosine triphosphatase n=1 Tax=Bacillus timonensis TaxID=1033734 RepID=A0A4S3PYB1_9BACI|nr:DUF84 family protein [Bacillus timonensis]THE14798.1 DUF84 family protein [Bacillus timonensis]
MLQVAIGTKNPAKVEAIKNGFAGIEANFLPISVSSGVSAQPFSDEETIRGAINRATSALEKEGADLGIGLEGGVVESEFGLFLCNWGAIIDRTNEPIIAGGARILLPDEIAEELKNGIELGDVMEEFTKQKDIRKAEGAIGIFTNHYVNRNDMFTHVVKLLVGQFTYRKNI